MRVLIIDPVSYDQNGVSTGHYLAVAQNLVEVFSSNYETLVMGGSIYTNKFSNRLHLLKRKTCGEYSELRNKWNTLLNVRQVYRDTTSEDILIWQSTSVVTILAGILLFGKCNRRSFLIQYDARIVSNWIFRILFSIIKRKLVGIICTLDEVGKQFNMPFCVVPDYIYCNRYHGLYLPYKEREYDFSMVGLIRKEKGIVEVARKLAGTKHKVLIAGRPRSEQIHKMLLDIASQAPNIELKLEYLKEEDYDQYIRNSKYCVLNYQGEYAQRTSGVIYDVIFKGTPVVVNDCKGLSFIKEHKLGYVFKDLEQWNPIEVLDATIHENYVAAIEKYFLIHKAYQQKINSFIIHTK